MDRHFLWEIIPQLKFLPQLDEAGWAHGAGDFAVHQPELGRSSAEGSAADTVLLLQASSEPRVKSLAWTWVQAGFKWGQRGQGGCKEPLLLLLVSSPPTQPCRGRLRDASTDRPLLLNTTTCLSRRTDRQDLPWLSGKVSQTVLEQRASTHLQDMDRGGSGAVGEMFCCSATPHPGLENIIPSLHHIV